MFSISFFFFFSIFISYISYYHLYKQSRAKNFRIVEIKIYASYPLFINLQIIFILHYFPEKYLKYNQSECRLQSQTANLKVKNLKIVFVQSMKELPSAETKQGYPKEKQWIKSFSNWDWRYPIIKFSELELKTVNLDTLSFNPRHI